MAKLYLLDTCIWRDFYENRFSKKGVPFGEYATKLFLKILKNKDNIIFSETLVRDLKKYCTETEITNMLKLLAMSKVLLKINITKEEYAEARNIAKTRNLPFTDCLNAVHARNYNAILVSQDRHFKQLSDIADVLKPQQII